MAARKARREIPRFNHPIFETHCHLDYLTDGGADGAPGGGAEDAPGGAEAGGGARDGRLSEVLARSKAAGVERILTIAVSPDNQSTVFELAGRHEGVWGTQGVHPHEAEHYTEELGAAMRARLADERIAAVGEIGLDYHRLEDKADDRAEQATQQLVFEAQLQIAADADMPVVIHTRDADADTRAILANFSSRLKRKGVIHSFTSGLPLAEFCLAEGFRLGFNGIITFKNADNVRAVAAATPLDRLLLETDAPYLTPEPYRGAPNAPCYLPFVAEKLAQIKSCPPRDLLRHAWRNSMSLFFPGQEQHVRQKLSAGLADLATDRSAPASM